ncbi:MAG: AAC(3) family N-acetyltransferase [Actinomycetota bacterium]|nr:AAC(3) family N-acetyltransferase [Actinomycetota bacterium]
MSEEKVIKRSAEPQTIDSLKQGFCEAGIKEGMVLLVHSSLSSLGWVCGREPAVIMALESLLGPEGTLVMPSHSGDLSDPRLWSLPPVPKSWWAPIKAAMPAFQPDLTPTRGMGNIAECFRKQKGVIRSCHPHYSFCAWGKHALEITRKHSLDFGLGQYSPLARIYDLEGYVLLIGVGHDSNTSLHLAEYRANYPHKKIVKCWAPIMIGGQRVEKSFYDINLECNDFNLIGKEYEQQQEYGCATLGLARIRLYNQKSLVDFAEKWMENNRRQPS